MGPYIIYDVAVLKQVTEITYAEKPDHYARTFFSDDNELCQPTHWLSREAKRVTRSGLGSELTTFAYTFDLAYFINVDTGKMSGKRFL